MHATCSCSKARKRTKTASCSASRRSWRSGTLEERDIRIKKALCGKTTEIATPNGPLYTRSIMLADLTPGQSLRLQEQGLGEHRHLGCGLFLPMKGILLEFQHIFIHASPQQAVPDQAGGD